MTDKPHIEVPRSLLYKALSFATIAVISLGLYVYKLDTRAIRTNQQAIQSTLEEQQILKTKSAVAEEKFEGHEKNPMAHEHN